jgi:hypothetical protein
MAHRYPFKVHTGRGFYTEEDATANETLRSFTYENVELVGKPENKESNKKLLAEIGLVQGEWPKPFNFLNGMVMPPSEGFEFYFTCMYRVLDAPNEYLFYTRTKLTDTGKLCWRWRRIVCENGLIKLYVYPDGSVGVGVGVSLFSFPSNKISVTKMVMVNSTLNGVATCILHNTIRPTFRPTPSSPPSSPLSSPPSSPLPLSRKWSVCLNVSTHTLTNKRIAPKLVKLIRKVVA